MLPLPFIMAAIRSPKVGGILHLWHNIKGLMATNAPSTARVKRLRERRSQGVALVAPVEVGEGVVHLLVRNGLLKQDQMGDRKAVGAACLSALEQWSEGRGARTINQG